MAQVRQSLAVAVILMGTKFIFQKKYLKFLLVILLASSFHITALFGVVLLFLTIRIPKRVHFVILLLGVFLMNNSSLIYVFIDKLSGMSLTIKQISNFYLKGDFARGGNISSGIFFYCKLFLIFFIVFAYKPKSDLDNFFINALVLSSVLTMAAFSFVMISRLEAYIGLYSIIGYTKFFEINFLKKNKSLLFLSIFIFLLFFFLSFSKDRLSTAINNNGRSAQYSYIPYYNVFLHSEDASLRKDWYE